MHQPSAVHQPYNPFTGTSSRPGSLITYRRVSLIIAGALLLTALILLLANSPAAGKDAKLQTSSDKSSTPNSTSGDQSTNTGSTNSGSAPAEDSSGTDPPPSSNHTQITVNGENIPVSSQGTTSRTITSGDSTTTVNVSNQSSSQGSSESSSSSNLNVNVNSNS